MKTKFIFKYLERTIEACWLLIIFFVPLLFFHNISYDTFELPKAVFFRFLTELILLLFVLKIFLKNRIEIIVDKKVILLSGVFISYIILDLLFSIHSLQSWMGSFVRYQGVFTYVHYLAFFLLVAHNLKNWQQIERLFFIILISSAVSCVYGLSQYFNLDFFTWQNSAYYQGRIFSTLGQPNFFAHWLIIVIPLSFYSLFYFKKNNIKFIIFILCFFQTICLFLTYSRAALISFILEIALFFIFSSFAFKKNFYNKKNVLCVVAMIFMLGIFCLFLKVGSKSVIEVTAGRFTAAQNLNINIRFLTWVAGINEIKNEKIGRLLFGYGQDTLEDVYIKHYKQDWLFAEKINSYPDRSHNIILDIILMHGLFGFFVFASFFGYFLFKSLYYLKNKIDNKTSFINGDWLLVVLMIVLCGYFINIQFSFSVIGTSVYLYLVLALIMYLTKGPINKEYKFKLSTISKGLIFLSIFFLIAVSGWLYNIKPALADYYLMQAVRGAKDGKTCNIIMENLNKSILSSQYNIEYLNKYISYNANCLKENSLDNNLLIKNNIENIEKLVNNREYNYEFKISLAHAYSLLGFYINSVYYKKAEELYKGLIEINPYITTNYTDLGRMKIWQKDYDSAIIVLNKGIAIIPNNYQDIVNNKQHKKNIEIELINFNYYLGEANYFKKDFANALKYYKKILIYNPFQIKMYKKIADIYYLTGDLNKAMWYNKRGMALSPRDYVWPYSLALLYREKEDKENALQFAEKALGLSPQNREVEAFIKTLK